MHQFVYTYGLELYKRNAMSSAELVNLVRYFRRSMYYSVPLKKPQHRYLYRIEELFLLCDHGNHETIIERLGHIEGSFDKSGGILLAITVMFCYIRQFLPDATVPTHTVPTHTVPTHTVPTHTVQELLDHCDSIMMDSQLILVIVRVGGYACQFDSPVLGE